MTTNRSDRNFTTAPSRSKQAPEKMNDKLAPPYGRLWEELKGKKSRVFLAIIFSAINGIYLSLLGFWLGDMLTGLTYFSIYSDGGEEKWKTQADDLIHTAMWVYAGLGIMCLISFTSAFGFFSEAGEHITKRLRSRLYQKFITNDMEFFDKEENGPGQLAMKLSTDCTAVNS